MEARATLQDLQTGQLISCEVSLHRGTIVGRKCVKFPLHDLRCSRQHAAFGLSKDGSLWVRDLKSTNGTFINGTRVTQAKLQESDIISFGTLSFKVKSVIRNANSVPRTSKMQELRTYANAKTQEMEPLPLVLHGWPAQRFCIPTKDEIRL